MEWSPDDIIQLSAVQHFVYCPRQCALIHLDQTWEENRYTAEGRLLHEKADSGKAEKRGDVKTVTGLLLGSRRHGVSGKADVVEFHRHEGRWLPYPVEYKRGRSKSHDADRIQLCMQALCLEEMLHVPVAEGALFYGRTRRREIVRFDSGLRESTVNAVRETHMLLRRNTLPPPILDGRCRFCSLEDICQPRLAEREGKAARYLATLTTENPAEEL